MSKLLSLALFLTFPFSLHAETLALDVYFDHKDYSKQSRIYQMGWLMLEAGAERANITLAPQPNLWNRSVKQLKAGKTSATYGALYTQKRDQWADFSIPLAMDTVSLFTSKESHINSWEDIRLKKDYIGVSRGSFHHQLAVELGFHYIYPMDNNDDVMKMLKGQRLDLFIFATAKIMSYCKSKANTKSDSCFKPIGEPLEFLSVHLMYKQGDKNTATLIGRINQQILAMEQDGSLKDLLIANNFTEAQYNLWQKTKSNWLKTTQ